MENKKIFKILGLAMAISGVVAYRELPEMWHVIMWIPISIGYSLWFSLK